MANSIKVRAKEDEGVVTVKSLISHPMETGLRKDKKTGSLIPAHFIQEVDVDANGKRQLTAYWSGTISKNPYLSFKYAGKKGDKLTVSWTDNKGEKDSAEATVK